MSARRVLFTSVNFYEYDRAIIRALENQGFEVTHFAFPKKRVWMPIFQNSKIGLLRRIYAYFFDDFDDFGNYCRTRISHGAFDFVLSINIPLSKSFLSWLKGESPGLKTIYYVWDSLSHYKLRRYFANYDEVFTFDKHDAKENCIRYLPNFWYINRPMSVKPVFDLFFLGKYSYQRHKLLVSLLLNVQLKYYVKLILPKSPVKQIKVRINTLYLFCANWRSRKKLSQVNGRVLSKTPVGYSDYVRIFNCSNTIIDIETYKQNGYSHRAILALALNKKLLTSNHGILNDENFETRNVLNIFLTSKSEILSWVRTPAKATSKEQYISSLCVENWVKTLLEC